MGDLPELAGAHQPDPGVTDVCDPRGRTAECDRGEGGARLGQVRQSRGDLGGYLGNRRRETASCIGSQRGFGDIVPVTEAVGNSDQLGCDEQGVLLQVADTLVVARPELGVERVACCGS